MHFYQPMTRTYKQPHFPKQKLIESGDFLLGFLFQFTDNELIYSTIYIYILVLVHAQKQNQLDLHCDTLKRCYQPNIQRRPFSNTLNAHTQTAKTKKSTIQLNTIHLLFCNRRCSLNITFFAHD